jgi:hypothetical protein
MREHFVALAIVRSLGGDPQGLERAWRLLRAAARSTWAGNAITLLQAAGGRLPHGDWPRLCLDHAETWPSGSQMRG